MFRRILLPLDGSRLAEAVLSQVEPILRRGDAEVLLLRVVSPVIYPYAEIPVAMPDLRGNAAEYLRGVGSRLCERGARVRELVEEGSPALAITRIAEREKVTLVAMATHGRTGLSRWVFGSVTEQVMRESPVPILVLRSFEAGGMPSPSVPLAFERIVVPVVHSRMDVFARVEPFARLFNSRVILVHVKNALEGEEKGESLLEEAREMARELSRTGIPAEVRERRGDPAAEILTVCREEEAGLIAMPSHGRMESRRALGSVSQRVLRASKVPLLVIRSA
jgi:nucleotide-binding universal stress UspA family protein